MFEKYLILCPLFWIGLVQSLLCLLHYILFVHSLINMFSGLQSTTTYMNQIWSLSDSPINSFTTTNWSSLVDLLLSLLTNPIFYWFIGLILIMSILPTVDDD